MKERACEAEHHEPNCPCERCERKFCGKCHATNQDHFTAKAVAKQLGWSNRQANKGDNLQWLSHQCHTAKDQSTPMRANLLKRQKKGAYISLSEYLSLLKEFK
jgi:prophage antirepressor-like protein